MAEKMKLFSIVVPVFYNELNIPDTIPELIKLRDHLPEYDFELVFVDDGSADRSLQLLMEYQGKYPETITVVKLTRNFGSMAAVQAGFSVARGDCVGMIAADLQDPPELFLEMLHYWEQGTKAIFAVRQGRQEPFLTRLFSNAYYWLLRRLALPGYPDGGFDFMLVDRQVIAEINRIREKNTNVMTLVYWLGFKPIMIPYLRRSRRKGRSRWTFSKKIKLFVDTFVGFSYFPIRLLSALGLVLAMGSFLYGLVIFLYWLFRSVPVQGYVPLMLVMTFASGLQMSMLGVLGEYLWRTLDESRRRPSFVIDEVYSSRQMVDSPIQHQAEQDQ
jgi:dolichol-phosphate mannosyltransferase